ncbi:MAG: copper amine oxidase N-terminal domain-containing protein [Clostridiales bacterium]|nr:copper amine oxidase N-terminal domain-containing protein [Clostridiales bacterium]
MKKASSADNLLALSKRLTDYAKAGHNGMYVIKHTLSKVIIGALVMVALIAARPFNAVANLPESEVFEPSQMSGDGSVSGEYTSPGALSSPLTLGTVKPLPNANPVNKVSFAFGKTTVTYPDGQTVEYTSSYLPLFVNGTLIKADIIIVSDYAMIPIRVLVETLGGEIAWDGDTQTVTINKGSTVIQMQIGSRSALVNSEEKTMDIPPTLNNNLTYLPLRFVSQNLGANVEYATGQYDVNSKKFVDFPIMQGLQGNVVVDEYDPSWPYITEDEAVNIVYSKLNESFNGFKPYYKGEHPELNLESAFQLIQANIDSTAIVGSASRYYVVNSCGLLLFDKYTGELYSMHSDKNSNWVRGYVDGDSDNYRLFTDGYILIP